jgi:four helix bundle protein
LWKLEGERRKRLMEEKKPIRSFRDLEVYQNTYNASLEVVRKIVPKLPKEERYDLADQLRRSSKAIPRLIVEGYSKKHQNKGFQKYLDDAIGESNETIVSLCHARDLYSNFVDPGLCDELIMIYDRSSRQMFNLAIAWKDFRQRK